MGGKIFIENVISDGLTGDLLILDGDGVPTTSSLLNYDGTTLTISGGNGTHIIRIASDSGGDSSVISSLASGSGTRFTSYNNAVNDFEPLQFVAEEISFSIRTGAGTSSEKFKFSTAGDLGISTTPVTWTNHRTMQIFLGAVSASTSQVALSYNTYYDGSEYRHTSTAASQLYTQDVVGHYWYAATSGTSGNVVAFVEKMSLRTSGVAIGGGFSPSAQLHVISTAEQLRLGYDTGNYTSFTVDSNGVLVIVPTALVAIGTGINLGNTADTTNGNIRYTGSDFEGRVGGNWMSFTGGGGTSKWTDVGSGNIYRNSNVMVGATTDPSAALHVIKTTEQMRLGYDGSNYTSLTTNSSGNTTITPTGSTVFVKGLALTANGLGYGGGPTIAVSADQTIQIAGGGSIDGIIHVTANGATGGLHQKVVLMVSAHQFDINPIVQVLSNHSYLGSAHMMTNFRFQYQTGGAGLRYLVCDIGNRGGQTINIYAVGVGISAGHVQLKLTPDTASPLTNFYGINVQRNGFVALHKQTTTNPFEVGSAPSDGNGAYLSATGNWTTGSDRNKKNTIVDLRYGLNDIDLVNVVEFYYNGSEELQFGVVAQELKEIMPELVDGLEPNMSVKTVQLVFPLIKAVQELHAKVKALESTLN